MKRVRNTTPLYKKLEYQFYENNTLPKKEHEIQILTEIKKANQPINSKDIKKHGKKYISTRSKMQKQYARERKAHSKSTCHVYCKCCALPLDKSKFMKDMLSQESLAREEEMAKSQLKMHLRSKVNQYQKLVQNTHRPKVSKIKREEVKQSKQRFFNERSMLTRNSMEYISNESEVISLVYVYRMPLVLKS